MEQRDYLGLGLFSGFGAWVLGGLWPIAVLDAVAVYSFYAENRYELKRDAGELDGEVIEMLQSAAGVPVAFHSADPKSWRNSTRRVAEIDGFDFIWREL